jgi:hypothetical protein
MNINKSNKCPNGKHNNYYPEEDSIQTADGSDYFECMYCMRDERNNLRTELKEVLVALKRLTNFYQDGDSKAFIDAKPIIQYKKLVARLEKENKLKIRQN